MLQAITLHATAKHTFATRRTRSSGVISRRKYPTVLRAWQPLVRWLGARTGQRSSIVHDRHIAPSKIAWRERRVLLLPLSTRWSTGVCPLGHRVTRPSGSK